MNRTLSVVVSIGAVVCFSAAALGQAGRIEEAGEVLGQAIAIAPTSFAMYVHERMPWMRPEDHDHWLDGMRKAGWKG